MQLRHRLVIGTIVLAIGAIAVKGLFTPRPPYGFMSGYPWREAAPLERQANILGEQYVVQGNAEEIFGRAETSLLAAGYQRSVPWRGYGHSAGHGYHGVEV